MICINQLVISQVVHRADLTQITDLTQQPNFDHDLPLGMENSTIANGHWAVNYVEKQFYGIHLPFIVWIVLIYSFQIRHLLFPPLPLIR